MTSPTFAQAARAWSHMREEFELYLEAQVDAALDACAGVLLNAEGRAAGIDPRTLFYGPWARAKKYASEELIDFWAQAGRTTVSEFERTYLEAIYALQD